MFVRLLVSIFKLFFQINNMLKKTYLILFSLIPLVSNAQLLVTTSSGEMSNNTVKASWTIGETIIETATTNTSALTSGFNQPGMKIATSVENIKNKLKVSIYPNPTSHFVNIKYEETMPLKVKIILLNGNVLSESELKDQNTQLDFSQKVSGIYILEITDKSGKSNTYRIVKQ